VIELARRESLRGCAELDIWIAAGLALIARADRKLRKLF